jgi:hypothetical protein
LTFHSCVFALAIDRRVHAVSFDFLFADSLGGEFDDLFDPFVAPLDTDAFATASVAVPAPVGDAGSSSPPPPPLSLPPPPLSIAMQAVLDTATAKLHSLQSCATACRFALLDSFVALLQREAYTRDAKVLVCLTHARASSDACTYALGSLSKAKRHAVQAAAAAAAAAAAVAETTAATAAGEDAQAKKRLRAAVACEACRIGKRRCERSRGAASCNHCLSLGVRCLRSDSEDDAQTSVTPAARVLDDALLEELGHSDDVSSYASIKMPSGVPQALLLPIRSAAVFARRSVSIDGPTIVNANDEFIALTGMSRGELLFSPLGVVLAQLNAGSVIDSLADVQRLMAIPSDRHVAKMPMHAAMSVSGTWFAAELTTTVVMRNQLPTLVHLAVDRVLPEQVAVAAPLWSTIPRDLAEQIQKHKEFVLALVAQRESRGETEEVNRFS